MIYLGSLAQQLLYLEGKPEMSAGVSSGMTSSVIGEENPPPPTPPGVEGEPTPLSNWKWKAVLVISLHEISSPRETKWAITDGHRKS